MSDLTVQERLQPSLLDRLTDNAPERSVEGRNERVISTGRLKECVTRDLSWLLNSVNLESSQDLQEYADVRSAVINFGIPDLAGGVAAGLKLDDLQRRLESAITAFEPRLVSNSLRVRVISWDESSMNRRALRFAIEAEMWAQPLPLNLYLKTEVDLETGHLKIDEDAG